MEIQFILDKTKRKALDADNIMDLNFLMHAIVENPPDLDEEKLWSYLK